MDAVGTGFWDLHATQEVAHADWSIDALSALDADPVAVRAAARIAADAWWDFLSEREALAPGGLPADHRRAGARSSVASLEPVWSHQVSVPQLLTASAKARARAR